MSCTCKVIFGIGLAGGIVGLHIYRLMTPKNQRELQRGLHSAVNDLKDLAKAMGKA